MLTQKIVDSLYGDSTKIIQLRKSFKRKQMLFGVLIGAYLGYKLGHHFSNKEDNENFLTAFESEDQIYHLAKSHKPVFAYFFAPGQPWHYIFRKGLLKAAKQYHEEADFVFVNCSKHYDVCRSKKFETIPFAELWSKDDNSPTGFKIQKYTKDFSYEGIEAFFENNNLIERKIDPLRGTFSHHSKLFNVETFKK